MTGQISLQVCSIHQVFGILHMRSFRRKDGELWLKITPLHLPHIQLVRNRPAKYVTYRTSLPQLLRSALIPVTSVVMLQAPLGSKHGAPFSETLRFPHPSARGPQLPALKRQQVDTLSHAQPVYLSEVIPSKMTAMAISSPCFVVREREIHWKERQTGSRKKKCVNDKDRVPQKDKQSQRSPIMALHC